MSIGKVEKRELAAGKRAQPGLMPPPTDGGDAGA